MSDVKKFIESGILEMYVLGNTTPGETNEVEQMAAAHPEVSREIDSINTAIGQYARAYAVTPEPTIGPMLMATIEYMERMKNGELPTYPPVLHEGSRVEDYAEWLNRKDLQLTEPLEFAKAHIIGSIPQVTTAIVWLRDGAPPETHTNEIEKFLIVEGTCNITVGNEVHSMRPGGVLIIPLHVSHYVEVTSDIPCKIILQRVAA
jgi:mannose-6-phosphate isomerase-like protein (cupin superfamily)